MLNPVATVLWEALADWQDTEGLVAVLAGRFPAVSREERSRAVDDALELLAREDLLEHVRP